MPAYREFTYEVSLSAPITNKAWIAERDSDWRLVMFPGTPARKYLFERLLRTAPADFEVVLLTRPGYGRGHNRDYPDFNDQLAAASPFLQGDKKVIALGASYGGELALKALLDRPDIVKGALTLSALINEPRAWVHPFLRLGGAPLVNSLLPRTLAYSLQEIDGRRAQIGALLSRLNEVTAPVTILHGDVDHLVAMRDARTLMGHFGPRADIEFRQIRGGTHFLEMQFPKLVFDAVRDVIARAGQGATKMAS